MLKDLYIVITDENGDMALGIHENISHESLENPPQSFQDLLNDKNLIPRLIEEAEDGLMLKKEIEKKTKLIDFVDLKDKVRKAIK